MEDGSSRTEVALGLAGMGCDAGIDILIQALGESRGYYSFVSICEALSKLANPRAIEPLTSIATNMKIGPGERLAAISALAELGYPMSSDLALEWLRKERGDKFLVARVSPVLARAGGERTTRELIRLLAHEYWEVRYSAINALKSLRGKEVDDAIAKTLNDPRGSVRTSAALALSSHGDRRGLAVLLATVMTNNSLLDTVPEIRALGKIGGPDLIEPLVRKLRRSRGSERQELAMVLGRFGEPARLSLERELADVRPTVRENAKFALDFISEQSGLAVEPS
jgi:HEAT repeat protein